MRQLVTLGVHRDAPGPVAPSVRQVAGRQQRQPVRERAPRRPPSPTSLMWRMFCPTPKPWS